MQTQPLPDDVPPHTFDGCEPKTKFEMNVLTGEVLVRADRIVLAHDVLQLFRIAASVKCDDRIADRYGPDKIWGVDIRKVAAYLDRTLESKFTTSFSSLSWANTFKTIRVGAERLKEEKTMDVAPRMRTHLADALRRSSIVSRNEAWENFQTLSLALAPIFSGEVTRADLSV